MSVIAPETIEAITAVIKRPEILRAIEEIDADIAARIEKIRPICQMSGRCCRFEDYGHRLFLTTIELAVFAARARAMPGMGKFGAIQDGGGCRFQQGGICSIHSIRPMGCRLFFCDVKTESPMQQLYEEMHQRVRTLHDHFHVCYMYIEWRDGLGAIMPLVLESL